MAQMGRGVLTSRLQAMYNSMPLFVLDAVNEMHVRSLRVGVYGIEKRFKQHRGVDSFIMRS